MQSPPQQILQLGRLLLCSGVVCGIFAAPAWAALPFDLGSLSFEENRGQLPATIHYRGRSSGGAAAPTEVRLERDSFVFVSESEAGEIAVRVRVRGARAALGPQAEDPLPGRFHYLSGPASSWVRDVRRFARVRYPAVARGVDLVFHEHEGAVEYDFAMAPGADPSGLALIFEGAESLRIDAAGRLHIATSAGELVWAAPAAYQPVARPDAVSASDAIVDETWPRERVAVAYRVVAPDSVAFRVGSHDESRPLVIDPLVLGSSSRLGGALSDAVHDIAIDPSGNIYLSGQTSSTDFEGATGANMGQGDAFLAKIAPDGSTLVYAVVFGGTDLDLAWGVAADAAGNAYVAGQTGSSTTFPLMNAAQPTFGGGMADGFLAKFGPTGTLLYSTFYGGAENDGLFDGGVAVDSAGIAYFAGRSESLATLPMTNAYESTCLVECAFLAGFDTTLSGTPSRVYGSFIGGNSNEGALDLAIAGNDVVYVLGFTGSDTDLIQNGQGFLDDPMDVNNRDHFVVALDPTLVGSNQLVYSTYIGGPGDEPEDACIATDGSLFWVTGTTDSDPVPFPIQNAIQATRAGKEEAYALRFDPSLVGTASLLWSTYIGGSESDGSSGCAVDSSGVLHVAGRSDSGDFPLLSHIAPYPFPSMGSPTDVVTSLSADGQTRLSASVTRDGDYAAVDASDRLWVVGSTNDPLFPLKAALPLSPIGANDIHLSRLDAVAGGGLRLEASNSHSVATIGEDFAFRYLVRNRGVVDLTDASLTTDFPAGLTPISVSASCTIPGATSDCDLFDPIPPGTDQALYLVAEGTALGSETVNASATSNEVDPDTSDNSDDASVSIATTGKPAAALTLADFDAVGNVFDIGEITLDTPRGVLGTANGSFDGGMNYMSFEGSIPLVIEEIVGLGQVGFGFVERTTWTPVDGDGGDLFGLQFNALADRVFATVDEYGLVRLYTGEQGDPGRLIAEGAVDLTKKSAFSLVIDTVGSNAQVFYGSDLIVEGDPFTGALTDADVADIGDDQVISIGLGTEFRGAAIITQVPEPGSALTMLAGALLLGSLSRTRIRA